MNFKLAARVFTDPSALVEQDRLKNVEERWQTVGFVEGVMMLMVAHSVREQDDIGAIRIISARRADRRERSVMKKKMIKLDIDLSNPPALTAAQKAELKALRAKPESEIDYRDIPPLQEGFWEKAVRNPFYRPT